ncbi:hypothetical protein D3C78_1557920 [compost metagenome]
MAKRDNDIGFVLQLVYDELRFLRRVGEGDAFYIIRVCFVGCFRRSQSENTDFDAIYLFDDIWLKQQASVSCLYVCADHWESKHTC